MAITTITITPPGTIGEEVEIPINDDPATGAQQGPVNETAPASDTAPSGHNGRLQRIAQRLTTLIDLGTRGGVVEVTSTITRPANTNAYTAGDAWSNSTSAPTAGGGTMANVVAFSGGSAMLTHLALVSSAAPATPLQGEIWLFDTAPTAINDNAAFSVSDAEMLNCIAQIPFALSSIGANSSATVLCGLGIKTKGSADLRFLVRVVNAYAGASAEALTIRSFYEGRN